MMSNGWIKLHRQLLEWEWYSDINVCRLFMHCLLKANHKDQKWQGNTIKSGSFISSQGHLSTQTGLTIRQIRTSLDKLKSTGELTVKITNKYSLYSITCWENYQEDDRQGVTQATSNRQADDRRMTTNKNVKNEKNDKENKLFNLFWQNYKRKTDRKKSELTFNRLTDTNKQLAIDDCKTRYQDTEKQFVPHATTYINGERWNDEVITNAKNNGQYKSPADRRAEVGEFIEAEAKRAVEELSKGSFPEDEGYVSSEMGRTVPDN